MEFENIHHILRNLYTSMMPLCSNMTGIAKGIAGLGALFYIAYRVWQSLARAEPIDVFPLLRPFVICICIMFFPSIVLGTINSIMSPIVTGTHQMLESETFDMQKYAQTKDRIEYEIQRRNPETAYLVDNEVFEARLSKLGITDTPEIMGMYLTRLGYNIKKEAQKIFREILEIVFKAAALIIDVIRTFFLIVLAILGPIAFAISVWDGFGSTLSQWLTRYITVYLWLPVSDLFSTILARLQSDMLQSDIARMQDDPGYALDGSDLIYIVFLLIGIVGYFTIPSVAGWIVQAGGMGSLGKGINTAVIKTGAFVAGAAGAATGNIGGRLLGNGGNNSSNSNDYSPRSSNGLGQSGSSYGSQSSAPNRSQKSDQ